MPRKPKSSAKSTPKTPTTTSTTTSTSYPNPLHPSLQSPPPIAVSNDKTSSQASYHAQLADWTAKNARAKAIIMSTLVPGSEPWRIAEPLEYAADIWKALEEKYGPNSERKGFDANDVVHDENYEQLADVAGPERLTADQLPASEDSLAQEVSEGVQEVAELRKQELEQELEQAMTQSTAEDTPLAEEKRKWKTDSLRDQRFLWALLNGGKEEEIPQTTGMKNHALGTDG